MSDSRDAGKERGIRSVEVEKVLREEAGSDPAPSRIQELAMTYVERGDADSRVDQRAALGAYATAVGMFEWLRARLGEGFTPDLEGRLARVHVKSCAMLGDMGDVAGALAANDRAIAIWESMRERLGTEGFTAGMEDGLASAYRNRGFYLDERGDHTEALVACDRAIVIWEAMRERLGTEGFTVGMEDRLASAYRSRGFYLSRQGDRTEALAACDRAIAMWEAMQERLGTEGFTVGMEDRLASAYLNRGVYLGRRGDHTEALAACDRAIVIWEAMRERLGTDGFTVGMEDRLASAYRNRGVYLGRRGDHTEALTANDCAIAMWEAMRERLGTEGFTVGMEDGLASAYRIRGFYLDEQGDHTEALAACDRAIVIWEAMRERLGAEGFTAGMEDGLASAYLNRGNRLDERGDHTEALAATDRAIVIWEAMRERLGTEGFTAGMEDGLASAYRIRGFYLGRRGDHTEALAATDRAIVIWEAMRERLGTEGFTAGMEDGLASAYRNRGVYLGKQGNHTEALAANDRAIVMWEAMRERLGTEGFTAGMEDGLASAYLNRGNRLDERGDHTEALAATDRAIAMWEAMRERLGTEGFTAGMEDGLASAYWNRGVYLGKRGDHTEALAANDCVIAMWEAMRERLGTEGFTAGMEDGLASAYRNRGFYLGKRGDHTEALAATNRAIAMWEAMRERLGTEGFTAGMEDELASAYRNRAFYLGKQGDRTEALAANDRAIAIWEAMRERLGTEGFTVGMEDKLASAYLSRGNRLDEQGDHTEAFAATDRAIAMWEAMRERLGAEGFTAGMEDGLASAYRNRGVYLGEQGDRTEAHAANDRAIAMWEAMRERLGSNFTSGMADNLGLAYLNRGVALRLTGKVLRGLVSQVRGTFLIKDRELLSKFWRIR